MVVNVQESEIYSKMSVKYDFWDFPIVPNFAAKSKHVTIQAI